MDIEEIRGIIRESLKRNIEESRACLTNVPSSFTEFRRAISIALISSGVSDHIVEHIEENFSSSDFYDSVYGVWENLREEISEIEDEEEKTAIWNESIAYYLPALLDGTSPILTESVLVHMRR